MTTLFENGNLIQGLRVPSTYVKTFISNFEEVLGNHSDVFMLVEALSPPSISIAEGVSKATVEVSVRLLNPLNEDFEALYMKIRSEAEVEFELLENYVLVGSIKDTQLEVLEFQTFFQSRVTVAQMNSKLDSLKKPLIEVVNSLLING